MSLLVTGSIGIDDVKTPCGEVKGVYGGSAVYFSFAALLYTPVRFVGVVGEDFPPDFRAYLERRNLDLAGLEVRSGSWRVRLRRDPTAAARPRSANAAGPVDAADETLGSVARSPGVGYFSPASPLVVGASVLAGDQLGSIDVLGIDQEVYAPADGIVARVLVEDGQAVEYGQALADIDPLEIDIEAEAGLEGDDG